MTAHLTAVAVCRSQELVSAGLDYLPLFREKSPRSYMAEIEPTFQPNVQLYSKKMIIFMCSASVDALIVNPKDLKLKRIKILLRSLSLPDIGKV